MKLPKGLDIEQVREAYRRNGDVRLSVPWSRSRENTLPRISRGDTEAQEGRFLEPDEVKTFIEVRSDLHATYIRETQRTRRFVMALAAMLLALACLIPVFAPEGREALSYWVGIALFLFSGGAAGYSGIRYKGHGHEIEASKEGANAEGA